MKQPPTLLLGALLVLSPFVVILPGCGGGTSGVVSPTATPTTTSPTSPPVGTLQSSNFYLSNGQKGILKFTTSGTTLTGTIEMLTTKVVFEGPKTRAFSEGIPPRIYTINGVQNPNFLYFSVTATRDGAPAFLMTARLPTASQAGSFSVSRVKESAYEEDAGPLFPIGQDFPPSVPKPTPTPVPVHSVVPVLTVQVSNDSNFLNSSSFYYADITPGGSKQNVSLSFGASGGGRIYGFFGKAVQGKVYSPDSADISTLPYLEQSVAEGQRLFTFQGGTIKVTQLTKERGELTFENALFAPKRGGGDGGAKGTVTINGRIVGFINGGFIGD